MRPVTADLGCGKRLLYMQTDRFKCECLSLVFVLPAGTRESDMDAMLLALSRHGTASWRSMQALSLRLDELYSTQISLQDTFVGDMRLLAVDAEFLGARYVDGGEGLLPDVVRLLSELILSPYTENGAYPEGSLSVLRRSLIDQLLSAKKSPRLMAAQRCMELLCPGEPCVRDHDRALDVYQTADAQTLARAHATWGARLCPILSYVGSAPLARVAALLSDAFAELKAPPTPYQARLLTPHGAPAQGELQMPVGQSRLVLGLRGEIDAGHPLAPAARVMNEILGASPASKLFLHVREERGLCYHCASALRLSKGILLASAGISAKNRAQVEEAMLAQFEALRRGEVSEEELLAAKRSIDLSYRQGYDAPFSLSAAYVRRAIQGLGGDVESWREEVARVTREEVVEAASRFSLGAISFLEGTGDGEEQE